MERHHKEEVRGNSISLTKEYRTICMLDNVFPQFSPSNLDEENSNIKGTKERSITSTFHGRGYLASFIATFGYHQK